MVLGIRSYTVAFCECEMGTGISEASKRVPIFSHDVRGARGGKQVSPYRNPDKDRNSDK